MVANLHRAVGGGLEGGGLALTWFKIDDQAPEHPKFEALEALGPHVWADAVALWTYMGCYCARTLSDGVVPAERLYRLTPLSVRRVNRAIEALERVGLVACTSARRDTPRGSRTASDVHLHDWSEYNPTRAEKMARRRANAEKQRRLRKAKNAHKTDNVTGSRGGSQTRSHTSAVDDTVAQAPPARARPDPDPDPDPPPPTPSPDEREGGSGGDGPTGTDDPSRALALFDAAHAHETGAPLGLRASPHELVRAERVVEHFQEVARASGEDWRRLLSIRARRAIRQMGPDVRNPWHVFAAAPGAYERASAQDVEQFRYADDPVDSEAET